MSYPAAIDHCCQRLSWQDLDPAAICQLIMLARDEDLSGWGLRRRPSAAAAKDVSAALLHATYSGCALLVARSEMVVCGLNLVPLIAGTYGFEIEFEPLCADGEQVAKGEALGRLQGSAQQMVQIERVALNFLQMLSGVATETRRYVNALGDSSTRLLDTRKTAPGYRMLQKYAVACGGGWNHRLGLFDRIMLKDNHLAATGSSSGDRLYEAVLRARKGCGSLMIEVEVDHFKQIEAVVEAGADVIMLDNFDNEALSSAVRLIQGRARTEASGGITLERLPSMAGLGLDFISTGATVHQSRWQDIGLDWQE